MFVAQNDTCGITHVTFEQRCRAGTESCITCELNLRPALHYLRYGQDIHTERSTTALTTSHGYTISAAVTESLKDAKIVFRCTKYSCFLIVVPTDPRRKLQLLRADERNNVT